MQKELENVLETGQTDKIFNGVEPEQKCTINSRVRVTTAGSKYQM